MAGPQKLHVWRGATDNDGIKLMMEHQGHKPLAHWLALGLDKVQQQLEGLRLAETEDGLPALEVVHRASGDAAGGTTSSILTATCCSRRVSCGRKPRAVG